MLDAKELYSNAKKRLSDAGFVNPNEINTLFRLAAGMSYPEALAGRSISDEAGITLKGYIDRRVSGEPLQYIAGSWPFLDFELKVGRGVLVPRPDTQALAEAAVEFLKTREKPIALDLCSGTGCVAIAVKRLAPESDVTALELSGDAFRYLEKNAAELASGVKCARDDAFEYHKTLEDASLDLITCNPPYVSEADYEANLAELRFEPRMALVSDDPLLFYKRIIPDYKPKLKPGGALMFEIGAGTDKEIEALFKDNGYAEVSSLEDMFGAKRVSVGKKP